MVIKSCLNCTFHEARLEDGKPSSLCRKESCWARFTKCLHKKALEKFLQEENLQSTGLSVKC
jgi:hypothetical protein